MKQLNAAQLSWLNKASKKAVSDIFQKNNDFKNNNWLKSTNSYLHDTINKIYQDDQSQSLNNGDLG